MYFILLFHSISFLFLSIKFLFRMRIISITSEETILSWCSYWFTKRIKSNIFLFLPECTCFYSNRIVLFTIYISNILFFGTAIITIANSINNKSLILPESALPHPIVPSTSSLFASSKLSKIILIF